MPVLKNPKHERFAQALAQGKSQTEAYELAGYKRDRTAASRLSTNANIQARVAELQHRVVERAVERSAISKAWVISRLVENAERAMQAKQQTDNEGNPVGDFKYEGSVANRALELLGKELGMFIDRKEIRQVDEFDQIEDADELRRRLAERAEELGEGALAARIAGGSGEAGSKPH